MGAIAIFNYANWVLAFPQFASLTETQVVGVALPLANQYLRNDGCGPVSTVEIQTVLQNLMVAHICQLLYGANGQSPSGLVGHIISATEGSVSVSVDFPTTAANAWYLQTPFGAAFWAATAPYRTMRYVPGQLKGSSYFNPSFFNNRGLLP